MRQFNPMQKRTCTHCHTIKSLSEFYIQKDRPSGYKSWCKRCANASVATYRQTAQGKKIVYENVRRYSHSKKGLEAAHRYRHSQKGLETARHYWHKNYRSEERRVGKEGRSRWSPY